MLSIHSKNRDENMGERGWVGAGRAHFTLSDRARCLEEVTSVQRPEWRPGWEASGGRACPAAGAASAKVLGPEGAHVAGAAAGRRAGGPSTVGRAEGQRTESEQEAGASPLGFHLVSSSAGGTDPEECPLKQFKMVTAPLLSCSGPRRQRGVEEPGPPSSPRPSSQQPRSPCLALRGRSKVLCWASSQIRN